MHLNYKCENRTNILRLMTVGYDASRVHQAATRHGDLSPVLR